ncbi:MAG TPA: alpha-L-arabinofuranosidase C-terminal domain-containing protein [Pyrinomonadaceae bacterium]|nr:alpha-L-arabinofuranosidase C-terminal domain-containing protein [Pyrinomonadaceae bacterium]
MKIERREFVGGAVAAGAGLLAAGAGVGFARSARAADSRVEVLVGEEIGTISRDIYGHFAEHLGGVVYDGIWVGENSRVPNTGGIRTALVEAMKRIRAPVVRWPGGCFADSYDWRDGTGPRARRPRRTNFWVDAPEWPKGAPDGPWKYEPNHFGTNEFLRFCQLTGAEGYLAANLRSLGAQQFYDWVEYVNSPAGSTTGAERRAASDAPSRDPYRVRFWGIGNESWGCGGNFTPEEYAAEYRRFTAAVPRYGVDLKFIASGANVDDFNWTRGFFSKTREKGAGLFNGIYGWGLHHYAWNLGLGRTNDWFAAKGDGLRFNDAEHYELLREADRMESLINQHWTIMGEYDRAHRVKLVVDEWGAWYKPGSEVHPSHLLGQQSTMRDALLAGLTLDTFHRHADKVAMANVAQLVNCLHSLFLAHEDKFILTPTFHVFEMFMPHMGAKAVRAVFSAPEVQYTRVDKPAEFWGLAGSASVNGKQLTLTVTNPHLTEAREAEIAVRGARVAEARARVLAEPDVHAHNTFQNPRAVEPRDEQVRPGAGAFVYRFAPASVTRLLITLA